MVVGKVIYSKRIKETLEDIYGIYPIVVISNPYNEKLRAWIFENNAELLQAKKLLIEKAGINNGKPRE